MSDVEKGLSSNSNGVIEANLPPNATIMPRPTRIANPGTLGLFSFASTTFILSMYNVQTRGIKAPNVVVGMAIFCGGLTQLLAGMWEFPRGNAFGGTGTHPHAPYPTPPDPLPIPSFLLLWRVLDVLRHYLYSQLWYSRCIQR